MYKGRRGIYIFGNVGTGCQSPRRIAHGMTGTVMDGNQQPVCEDRTAGLRLQQPCFHQHVPAPALSLKEPVLSLAAGGPADFKGLQDLIGQFPFPAILLCGFSFLAVQKVPGIVCKGLQTVPGLLIGTDPGALRKLQVDARHGRRPGHSFWKRDLLDFLQEGKDIAAGSADKAFEDLLVGAHRHGRIMIIMKGTDSLEFLSVLFQTHIL